MDFPIAEFSKHEVGDVAGDGCNKAGRGLLDGKGCGGKKHRIGFDQYEPTDGKTFELDR